MQMRRKSPYLSAIDQHLGVKFLKTPSMGKSWSNYKCTLLFFFFFFFLVGYVEERPW